MNRNDFFNRSDYEKIKCAIDKMEEFEVTGKVKKQELTFCGTHIDDRYSGHHTSKGVWKNDYNVHIDERHYQGGMSYATDNYKDFETFESFMRFVDSILKGRPEYEVLEVFEEQMSLL